jgi:hypothetical protein
MNTGLRSRAADDTDGLAGAFSRAGIRLGSLSANRQAAEVPDAPIALDALQALEVHTDFPAKIAFNDVLAILNGMHDLGQLLFAEIFGANGRVDIGLGQNDFRVAWANAVNVAQGDVDALIRRNFYTYDTSHSLKLD